MRVKVQIKVQIKVTVDGQEVGEVTNFQSAKQLERDAQDALAGAAAELRTRAGLG